MAANSGFYHTPCSNSCSCRSNNSNETVAFRDHTAVHIMSNPLSQIPAQTHMENTRRQAPNVNSANVANQSTFHGFQVTSDTRNSATREDRVCYMNSETTGRDDHVVNYSGKFTTTDNCVNNYENACDSAHVMMHYEPARCRRPNSATIYSTLFRAISVTNHRDNYRSSNNSNNNNNTSQGCDERNDVKLRCCLFRRQIVVVIITLCVLAFLISLFFAVFTHVKDIKFLTSVTPSSSTSSPGEALPQVKVRPTIDEANANLLSRLLSGKAPHVSNYSMHSYLNISDPLLTGQYNKYGSYTGLHDQPLRWQVTQTAWAFRRPGLSFDSSGEEIVVKADGLYVLYLNVPFLSPSNPDPSDNRNRPGSAGEGAWIGDRSGVINFGIEVRVKQRSTIIAGQEEPKTCTNAEEGFPCVTMQVFNVVYIRRDSVLRVFAKPRSLVSPQAEYTWFGLTKID